jgi:hypothetical protein
MARATTISERREARIPPGLCFCKGDINHRASTLYESFGTLTDSYTRLEIRQSLTL